MIGPETLCYVVQGNERGSLILCVKDNRADQFHMFPLSPLNASRLAAECSAAIHAALGGVNHARTLEEVAALWAAKNDPPSDA